jgi:hypothetical protein
LPLAILILGIPRYGVEEITGLKASGQEANWVEFFVQREGELYLLKTLNGHSTPGAACSIPDIDISSPTVGPLWSFRLHVSNKSEIAQQALINIGQLCEVTREVKHLSTDERGRIRKDKSKPLVDALH